MAEPRDITNPPRRPFLAGAPVAAFAAPDLSAKGPDDRLRDLLEQLRAQYAARAAFTDMTANGKEWDRHHNQMWSIREKIDAIRAASDAGVRFKAMAAQMALEDDRAVECDGLGSFASLSQSIIRDLLAA